MSITVAITDRLASENVGIPGVSLFREQMPVSCVSGVLVMVRVAATINPYVRELRKGQFQVIARAKSEDDARALGNSVIDALVFDGEFELGGITFKRLYPENEPLVYPEVDSGNVECSVNFNVIYLA